MSVTADARTAVGFLTRIPVTDRAPLTSERLSRAAAWFPAVGLLVGGVLGGTRLLADLALPAGPSTILALTAAILVTGGFHEDGLADSADGLGAHVGRERKLEILRDSRVGTYGALAVTLSVLLAYSLLSGLSGLDCLRAALVGHVLGRWSGLPHSMAFAPARTEGSGVLVRATPAALAIGTAIAVATALVAAGPGPGAIALGVAALVTALAAAPMARALGGTTGDTYGAVNKLVELAAYAALVAAW
jgi:adenosylcobinamide-GDP ribazoletransferase